MLTKEELAQWADEEGGWASLIKHGVWDHEVPLEVRDEWLDTVAAHDHFERVLDRLKAKL